MATVAAKALLLLCYAGSVTPLRAGTSILALIRGSAVNQDGRSAGMTAPNGPAQVEVIRSALKNARLAPEQVDYVEAHGTGTSLGDPIELQAIAQALGTNRSTDNPLLVGSCKTNFGHLEAAAGITGLIKAVLSLARGKIPPHLHFETPNPMLDWKYVAPARDYRSAGLAKMRWTEPRRSKFFRLQRNKCARAARASSRTGSY